MRKGGGWLMKIAPLHLPEFGLDVSWAMCRNPMCSNFGMFFEGEIPEGRKQVSDDRYAFRLLTDKKGGEHGEIQCRYCKQSARLASNRAIRPIARYFLSLSLPFADCPDRHCANHGFNVFEHWAETGSGQPRRYRRQREHEVTCLADGCGKSFSLGTALGVMRDRDRKACWGDIVDGLRAKRSVSDTIDLLDITAGSYYANLKRIGARLQDYHSFRNAQLLRRDIAHRDESIGVYTDVLEVSLQAFRETQRHVFLRVIVSAVIVDETIFVLAAHPCFYPESISDRRRHERPVQERGLRNFETEWDGLWFQGDARPGVSTKERKKSLPEFGRGGWFMRSPYAEVAHFLVVRKMLDQFETIHCYMDGAKELYGAALVAFRDRILAGRPESDAVPDRRRQPPKRAEIVVFQHDTAGKRKRRQPKRPDREGTGIGEEALSKAWKDAEKRFKKEEVPRDLLKGKLSRNDPKVRARVFKRAFKGAYSEMGGWAWLRYPRSSIAYHRPRTLWLTRMPVKTFRRHGEPVLLQATLQPVDSIINSIRARMGGTRRPHLRADGHSYRESYVLPSVVLGELSVYLFGRNYTLRRARRSR